MEKAFYSIGLVVSTATTVFLIFYASIWLLMNLKLSANDANDFVYFLKNKSLIKQYIKERKQNESN